MDEQYVLAVKRAAEALDGMEWSARQVMAGQQEAGADRRAVDNHLCIGFGVVMSAKVELSAVTHGRTRPEWRDTMTREQWERETAEHIVKGDPRDVGAYMAIGWARGWSTDGVFKAMIELYHAAEDEVDTEEIDRRLADPANQKPSTVHMGRPIDY